MMKLFKFKTLAFFISGLLLIFCNPQVLLGSDSTPTKIEIKNVMDSNNLPMDILNYSDMKNQYDNLSFWKDNNQVSNSASLEVNLKSSYKFIDNKDIPITAAEVVFILVFIDPANPNLDPGVYTNNILDENNDQYTCEKVNGSDNEVKCSLITDIPYPISFPIKVKISDTDYTPEIYFDINFYRISDNTALCQLKEGESTFNNIIVQIDTPRKYEDEIQVTLKPELSSNPTINADSSVAEKIITFTFTLSSMNNYGNYEIYILDTLLDKGDYIVRLYTKKNIDNIKPIYAKNNNEPFDVVFTENVVKDDEMIDWKFTSTSNARKIVMLTCALQNLATTFKCQGDFTLWSAEELGTFSWSNKCNIATIDSKSYKLTVNTLKTIDPSILKIENTPPTVELIYNAQLSSLLKELILTNKETNPPPSISLNGESTETNNIDWEIPTTIVSGLYSMKSKLNDDTTLDSDSNVELLIFREPMGLEKNIQRVPYDNLMPQIKVKFINDMFYHRFEAIKYQKGTGALDDVTFKEDSFDKSTQTMTISVGNTFKVDSDYNFIFYDKANSSPKDIKYTLQAIIYPTTVKITEPFYYKDPINIEFNKPIISTDFIVKSNDGQFTLTQSISTVTTQKFTLTLKPASEAVYGKKDIEFKTIDNVVFITTIPSLLIINDDIAPKTIITQSITHYINQPLFYIKFIEILYNEYNTAFTIEVKNNQKTLTCNINKVNVDSQQIEVKCTDYQEGVYSISMKFAGNDITKDKPIEFTIFTKCPPGLTINRQNKCEIISVTNPVTNCFTYCFLNNFSTCSIVNYQPICVCKPSYYGLTCEVPKSNLEDTFKQLFDQVYKQGATEPIDHPTVISNLLSLRNILNTSKDETLVNKVTLTIDKVQPRLDKTNQFSLEALKYIDFAMNVLKLKLKKLRPFRSLSSFDERVSNESADDILIEINKILQANRNFLIKKYYFQRASYPNCLIEDNQDLFCSSFTNTASTYQDYVALNKKTNHAFVDISNSIKSGTYTVIQTERSSELHSLMVNINNSSSYVDLITLDGYGNEINSFSSGSLFLYNYPLTNIPDPDDYVYYYERDIDIYDPTCPAYNTLCYTNLALGYDFSQYYRKFKLYRNMTIVPDNLKCTYKGLDTTDKEVLIDCPAGIPPSGTGFSMQDFKLTDSYFKAQNIPINCAPFVRNIHKNIAFWLFLVLTFVFLVVTIIIASLRGCGVIQYKQIQTLEKESIELQIRDEEIPLSNIRFDEGIRQNFYNNKLEQNLLIEETFGRMLCQNLLNLHPILSLCQESVLSPINFKLCFFIFNLFVQYGFLAVYYFETMMDNAKGRRDQFEFGYTVRYDFDKIVYAILTSILFTMVIRCIVLITLADKGELVAQVDSSRDLEAKYQKCEAFSRKMLVRRIIAGAIMLGLSVFFWVYCVVFCGIYLNTQFVWFYSCIWIMFFNWLMFIPFTILILSAIEYSNDCRTCAYYFKQVFIF